MTRILALVTEAYGGGGGIAQAARDLIGALAAQDTVEVVDVLPRCVSEEPQALPAKVRQLAPSAGRTAYTYRAFAAASGRPDLVFCNHLYMAPIACLVAWLVGAKLIVQLHGIEIWKHPTRIQRAVLERACLILCVSRDTRARVLSYCNIVPERALVLNNTVDPHYTLGDRSAARSSFGVDDEFVLLSVGRLDARERYKGHDRIIAILSRLSHPDGRRLVYLIAGDGDDRSRLEAEAAAANVGERVRFLGKIAFAQLPDLYRAADLFVLPSTGEGFGIVFVEAMACGTPAFGLAQGGVPDALGDGALGTLVSNPDVLPDALQLAISASRSDAAALSAAIEARFGTTAFQESVSAWLRLLDQART